jgi:prolyl-tRNA synthetase
VKFSDADLIGLPVRVTVGSRSIKAGTVDLTIRHDRAQKSAPPGDAVAAVGALLDALPF